MIGGGADYQSSPTVVDGTVFIGTPARFVFAIDAGTGEEKWRFEASGQVSGSPTYASGSLYFGQQGGNKDFCSVDAKTGEPRWNKALGWVWTTVAIEPGRGRLVVGTVVDEIHSPGVDGWVHQTNGGIYPAPAADRTSVYTGSWDGYFYALDALTGKPRWT